MSDDPVADLAHDHADLNRRVLALGAIIEVLGRGQHAPRPLVVALGELRELLFFHFAREEEGLFPFVSEALPELADTVHQMELAHDAICGALARMYDLAASDGRPSLIQTLYERFQTAYADHARHEATLLVDLQGRLDAAQRARLAALVAGL